MYKLKKYSLEVPVSKPFEDSCAIILKRWRVDFLEEVL
jgi:hypothetical protein